MNIISIKNFLRTKVGSRIVVIYYGSRHRKEIYRGVLCKLYGNIFMIRLANGDVKSFSYCDILTKTIRVCV